MPELLDRLAEVEGFDWDESNARKIRDRHGVRPSECEEVFSNAPRVVADPRHSTTELRYVAFGETRTGRQLAIAFTVRAARIRVVTARDQSRKERRELAHGEKAEADPELS